MHALQRYQLFSLCLQNTQLSLYCVVVLYCIVNELSPCGLGCSHVLGCSSFRLWCRLRSLAAAGVNVTTTTVEVATAVTMGVEEVASGRWRS